MDKKNPTLFQMFIVLAAIALVCAAGVSLVYNATKPVIDQSRLNKKIQTVSKIVPEFDNSPVEETFFVKTANGDSLQFYPAKKGNELVGMGVSSYSTKGYGGRIDILVGFKPDGTIFNTEVVQLNETPGLGDKSDKNKSPWANQFNDKNPKDFKLLVKKDGGDVDAISAATITSRAYTEAVDLAYKTFIAHQNGSK